jgi:hypothetical protein
MRFLYYLFIVRRRLTFLTLALAFAAGAWSVREVAARAMVRNDAAAADRIQTAFQHALVTDWDMCAQFYPDMANQENPFNATPGAGRTITNGDLERINDLIAQCARVTVPLTGERAALARRKAGLPPL